MEKAEEEKKAKPPLWDCGSSLYDSFELKSFERQLDSAISSRTLSMPHLSLHRAPQPQPQPQTPISRKPSKISRSLQKFLRSVFRPKHHNTSFSKDGFYVVYDTSGVLSTIPELPETAAHSPEIKSLVKRSASVRFSPTSIGISCA